MKFRYFGFYEWGPTPALPDPILERHQRKPKGLRFYEYLQWFLGLGVAITAITLSFEPIALKSAVYLSLLYLSSVAMLLGAVFLAMELSWYRVFNLAGAISLLPIMAMFALPQIKSPLLLAFAVAYIAFTLYVHFAKKYRQYHRFTATGESKI